MSLARGALIAFALLNFSAPQEAPLTALPAGVLKKLDTVQKLYCEDQFGDRYKKGCDKKFAGNLKWIELPITPMGQNAILIENDNLGFCGSGGCALYLFVQQPDASFAQVLGTNGDMGTLKRFAVLKTVSKGYYDVQITWTDRKTKTTYRWSGSRYVSTD
jgi:hypothetical protein